LLISLLVVACLNAQPDSAGGMVVDQTGKPLAGVHVRLITVGDSDSSENRPAVYGAVSDKAGQFSVSSNFCEISGTVSDSKGPMDHAYVMLVSQEDPSITQSSGSDSGTYKFRVPPGKYKLAAVDGDVLAWGMQGPDLDDYEVESVDLSAGDKVTKDLRRK